MTDELQVWLERLQNHPTLPNISLPNIELKLERIQHFLSKIGNPHLHTPPVVHIAGTNGKGSTLAFIHSIIMAAGLQAHRYTSPHLVRFNERFIVANQQISDARLLTTLTELAPHLEAHPLTYFEATTALGFWLFAQSPADFTLLEVGMGGRFDATNVVPNPAITAIAPISLDHTEFLGDTIAKIAFEKAGIIKAGVPCIVGGQPPQAMQVIERRAQELQAPLFRHGKEWDFEILADKSMSYHSKSLQLTTPPPSLLGAHQYQNAALAVACVDMLLNAGLGFRVKGLGEAATNASLIPNLSQATLPSPTLLPSPPAPLPQGEGGVPTECKPYIFAKGSDAPPPLAGGGWGEGSRVGESFTQAIQQGIATATWEGRLQQINLAHHGIAAEVFVDGGHNAAGAETIAAWLTTKQQHNQLPNLHLIMGLKADKDAKSFIARLAPFAVSLRFVPVIDIICHPPTELVQIAAQQGFSATAHPTILNAATNIASDDMILIAGSLYLVGTALSLC